MRSVPGLLCFLVVLAACGGSGSDPGTDPDARLTDAPDPDAPDTSATPPPPCLALADEPTSCRECLGGPSLAEDASLCTQAVCALDPSCCTTLWDQRCVQLADAHCEIDECLNAVSFTGGNASLVIAQWDGAEVVSDAWTSFPDQLLAAADWADYDGDGLADAALASECFVRVLAGRGWSGDQIGLVPVFTEALGCGTPSGSYGSSVRWVDVDEDGDLDVIAAGSGGGFWVEYQAGALTRAGDLVAPGSASIASFTVGDLDSDRHVDVIAMVWRNRPGTDDRVQTLERFEYDPLTGFVARPTWGQDVYYHGVASIRSCELGGDTGRELVFAGWLASFGHRVIDGVLGTTVFTLDGAAGPVTCANLDDDPQDEVIINRRLEGGLPDLAIIDNDTVVWQSSVDLAVPFSVTAGALEALDVDDDGDLDLVVGAADDGGVEGGVTVLRRQAGAALAFTVEPFGDLLVGHDMHAAGLLHLPRRPAVPTP